MSTVYPTQTNGTNATLSNVFTKSNNTVSKLGGCHTAECISVSILTNLICIIGIIANFIAVLTIVLDKKLHKPTFCSICCLSISDFMFLLTRYTKYIVRGYFKSDISKSTYRAISRTMDTLGLTSGKSSIAHIVLLSVLRYVIVVYPLKSTLWVSNRRVKIASGIAWFVSFCSSLFFMYAVGGFGGKLNLELANITNISVTAIWSIFPMVLVIAFHTIKAKRLMKSLSGTGKTVRRMSKIVTMIVITFVVTMTPINVKDVLEISAGYYTERWFVIFTSIARLFLFLNYAVNPFIYFVHSPTFRKSVKRLSQIRKQASYETSVSSISSGKTSKEPMPHIHKQSSYETSFSNPSTTSDKTAKEPTRS